MPKEQLVGVSLVGDVRWRLAANGELSHRRRTQFREVSDYSRR
jgi:hypothetical protein